MDQADRIVVEKVERKGLFRWHSFEQLRAVDSVEVESRWSSVGASLDAGNDEPVVVQTIRRRNDESDDDSDDDASPKCKNYGAKYLPSLAMSIWLKQWSGKNKFEMDAGRRGAIKMKRLTVNELVGAVYLADERDLWTQSRRPIRKMDRGKQQQPMKKKTVTVITGRAAERRVRGVDEDTMTMVSSTTEPDSSRGDEQPRPPIEHHHMTATTPTHEQINSISSSSTLEISSLTDNHVITKFMLIFSKINRID